MKIIDVLNEGINLLKANNIEDARIQGKILMSYILNENEQFIIINQDKECDREDYEKYKISIMKIIQGTPIQYITNNQEFMKMNFYVDENVLIPQPDTEILVEEAIKIVDKENIEILDLCTGSGAIGISLAKNIDKSHVTATDISIKAIQIAKLNAEKNLVHRKMDFFVSDLFGFEESLQKKFDMIVSNPPYIKSDVIKSLSKQVQNEPIIALDGGENGCIFYEKIVKEAYKYLNSGGYLLLEIGYDQKKDVINLLEKTNKYDNIKSVKDLSKNDRVIIAKLRK